MKRAALFLAFAVVLFADGGSVLLRKQSHGVLITVFGNPRVGATDFSVLVQNAADLSPVLDAQVDIRVAHNIQPATHQQATNKLLYAASLNFFRPGRYSMQVNAWRNGQGGSIDGDILVAPASPPLVAYWPYFALVPAAVLLFILNEWLKSKRRVRRLEAPPLRHSGH